MSSPRAEILSQGDEIIHGDLSDTNAAWLAQELCRLGFSVVRHSAAGDDLHELIPLLREIAERADLCLCTGGLGPTCDDLTAEAVSQAFHQPLIFDPQALSQIEAWFQRSHREMPRVNRKQAYRPEGSTFIDNRWGTAPGFTLQAQRCRFFFLPGVPREMQAMFTAAVAPELSHYPGVQAEHRVTLQTIGLGESTLQSRLEKIERPEGVRLGFRTLGAENQVKLAFPARTPKAVRDALIESFTSALGSAVYAIARPGSMAPSLAATAGQSLRDRQQSGFVVETLSGGHLATLCRDQPWFAGAWIETDARKLARSGRADATESPAQLLEMARELHRECESDFLLFQWSQGDLSHPKSADGVTLQLILRGPDLERVETRTLSNPSPERARMNAALYTLDFMRRQLATAQPA